jgi:hypothetical protein
MVFAFKAPGLTYIFPSYVSEDEARSLGLIWETDTLAYIGVDHSNTIEASQRGRPSVRIESRVQYTHGLIIGSFWNMPGGECGTWPALYVSNKTPQLSMGDS